MPLHYAALIGSDKAIELLLKNGAELNARALVNISPNNI